MDFSPETYAAADRFFAAQWQRGLIPGYLGKPGTDGSYEFFVVGDPGRQYVRIWRGEQQTVTTCTNLRAPLEPNNLVWLRRFNGDLVVEMSDPSTARVLFGDNVGAAGVPYYVTLHENDLVPGTRLLDGLLRASALGGTYLHIESFEYDGGRYESDPAGATDVDVDSYYPATTDEYGIIGVYLDPSDGSIVAFAGEHHAALGDFAYNDRDNVPDAMYPIGAVLVQEGDGISEANSFFDWRLHTSVKGAGSGTFSGDATDVPYAPTTSGDWTEGAPDDVGEALDVLAAREVGGGASVAGWLPYAYPIMFTHDVAFSISQSLPAAGGSAAIPFVLGAPMLLESVTIFQSSTSSERTWGWDLYWQANNTGDSGENTLARLAACSANDTFTPSAATVRTLTVGSPPVSLDAGLYWLVIQNRHASNTFELALHEVNNFARSGWQYKTTTNPNGATLDFVAATWGKSSEIPAARLNGRVFGQTTAF